MIILICCNDSFSAYTFRRQLIHSLMKNNYHVFVLCEGDDYTKKLIDEGINVININMFNTSKNIIKDLLLYQKYRKIVRILDPDVIINYSIKPHIYMSLAARNKDIKIINFVAGISSLLYTNGMIQTIIVKLYRYVSKFVGGYIFLNNDDLYEFDHLNIIRKSNKTFLLDSEGVDLSLFKRVDNQDFQKIKFLFVGRLVKEKGLMEYLDAAVEITRMYPNVEFYIAGQVYEKGNSSISLNIINNYEEKGIVKYLGFIEEMNNIYKDIHVVVLPSYREGMPICLLEALATGRPIIASNVPGSKDIVQDYQNGFSCDAKSVESLKQAMVKYLELSNEEKENLSLNAFKMASKYDVNRIIEKQLEIIESV